MATRRRPSRPTAASRSQVIPRVGGVRPSQLMWSAGVGSVVDLPSFSVLVLGLDDWDATSQARIAEDRLLAALRSQPGLGELSELRAPPWEEETRSPFDHWALVGVPVVPFPRWLRCSRCNLLAPIDSTYFSLETRPYRPDQARYAHVGCGTGRAPTAVPARFVTACPRGHLDEFPWEAFVHAEKGCTGKPILEAFDLSTGTRSTDVLVRCRTCREKRGVAQAFGEGSERVLPQCRGRRPQLRDFDPTGCPEQVAAMLLGASNAWFPVTRTALSIPVTADPLAELVAEHWSVLASVTVRQGLDPMLEHVPQLAPLRTHDPDRIWSAVLARHESAGPPSPHPATVDLMGPEWEVFARPETATQGHDFRVARTDPPLGWEPLFRSTVLVERLRTVTALAGFTRIDSPDASDAHRAPLTASPPTWLPAAQSRGEGVFLRLDEATVHRWEAAASGAARLEALRLAHQRWRQRRGLEPAIGWPGARYVLLHSLAHALINELALECGYSAASVRERIYASEPGDPDRPPMAGILLYTAAPDAEGTLGGLVQLGRPELLGPMVTAALERASLCASDPLCAEHTPAHQDDSLHGAACHACLYLPETSCERANRYLDRGVLVATLADATTSAFDLARHGAAGPR